MGNWESVTKVVSAYDIFLKSNQQDLFCVMFLSLPSLYFCFVAGLDKVHLALLRSNGGKIWQSCLIMVALIILHFSLFSVKCEFHHCNLERIFGQPHFSSIPSAGVLPVRLRSAPSTIFGCEDESWEAGLNFSNINERSWRWLKSWKLSG